MNNLIFLFYYSAIVVSIIIGVINHKHFQNSTKAILAFLFLTATSEIMNYTAVALGEYGVRYAIFHFYSIVEISLILAFFTYALKIQKPLKIIGFGTVVFVIISIVNIIFLQPLDTLNTNIILLEGFTIISLSLYSIYHKLKSNFAINMFIVPDVQVSILFLLSWCGTFFFWSFIKILYSKKWNYIEPVLDGHMILNIFFYTGIAAVFYFYPKKRIAHEHS
ncbi:MAG: hypothetical protein H6551_08720 [Chitinophagales bacterium]|nr:hypothetical protein [Chitinophagaceae bacterium]MCB9065203.1 hypothetical protein [Chitinophagales bacterium]